NREDYAGEESPGYLQQAQRCVLLISFRPSPHATHAATPPHRDTRTVGLMKKAMELSILCDCDIALIIFSADKLFQYSSINMDTIVRRYIDYDGAYEGLTNKDVRGCSRVHVAARRRTLLRVVLIVPRARSVSWRA